MESVLRYSRSSIVHNPVLVGQVIDFLIVSTGKKYLDLTVGAGGHSLEIIKRGGRVLGIDLDPEILARARQVLGNQATLVEGNYKDADLIAKENGFEKLDGILLDLGLSSFQLDSPERGFSFRFDAPLDMRMSPELGVRAVDLVNGLNVGELEELFMKLGEEKQARRIAKEIVGSRVDHKITTTTELAEIVKKVKKVSFGKHIHPATQVFQALRIAVNDELNNLREVLPKASSLLGKDGRLVVISFHSLEDRIVKDFFKSSSELKVLTEKPITASEEEVGLNPRSRSAKMRVAEKLST
ncbi:MAG: 16S rRNA (cytosine(1402)-N(4))-methyltransferase [Candidatus Woykebacteria bacterium RIFCSPHIGHO2_12_FULL_43_10]|uniref:Ribosomal RNA small subunit methyltransferase H n=2 Tax=Candidatus Woykeibacteriota TaxID=1817899 RepID=A0A1G1WYR4_9BACT|nr:MAG: 16S rRNA (cytosine(1402)-N(4))-methyltransferase [Candidatus Woykebacteria bacterium RIFCSPHIGHO2_12_FULL_43_10]OGY29097.1 MAG: 16S rRNA (cytosine(1402)-N(4))-methyltransferase [Candidatus Woykebacteria bacterium RIFCSPHIGHO2_02_FULL_43_16b]OGY32896.1 MAG: 16S rRNA (cytosine(1402)-N(4))-methyltransferase [Candidatus Woykebacteria bacterium RIFCSPLOWO2_01_FULL_43_14]